jgi:hypothetical protein
MNLDNVIKGCHVFFDMESLRDKLAEHLIPFEAIQDNAPWNGCKFAAMAVMHLVSERDAASKKAAVRPVCRSLGGCTVPPPTELRDIRWPYDLSPAVEDSLTRGVCTAILVSVTDVEIMRNPSKNGGRTLRPGTFAHSFVITVSRGGVMFSRHMAHVVTLSCRTWNTTVNLEETRPELVLGKRD